jgi:D-alanine-D-alanine ligase
MSLTINRDIVVVADQRSGTEEIDSACDNLDQYTFEHLDEILEALRTVCASVKHYASPKEFLSNIDLHSHSVLLPLWSGRASRNRTALVAAISEAAEIDYFGADTYVYIVGQDKTLSKMIAVDSGLITSASVVIRTQEDFQNIDSIAPPWIVKPIGEGSSIGISRKNLCTEIEDVNSLCLSLLSRFSQPVMVEHFVEGLEATVTMWGPSGNLRIVDALEIFDATGTIDFTKTIWSLELKTAPNRPTKGERALSLYPSDKDALIRLFRTLGRAELLRIDGRVDLNGRFTFLEMNPEPDLTRGGSVATSFRNLGFNYAEMFYELLLPFDTKINGKAPVGKKAKVVGL